jgi:hypothetical protein
MERRLQILLDEERHRRLTAVAEDRGVAIAVVVREAIDRGLATPDRRRREAADRVLAAPDMDVPEPAVLHAELEQLRGRRA